MPESTLYQFLYHPAMGYLVYRRGLNDNPPDIKEWAEIHKQAIFVHEMAAVDYCDYRNRMVDKYGDDRLPLRRSP